MAPAPSPPAPPRWAWCSRRSTRSAAATYTLLHGGSAADIVERAGRTAVTTIIWGIVVYALLVLVACLAGQARRSLELRSRLAHAELALLRAQLEPHFLFNALHTIGGLIRAERPQHATAALSKLSELLRYVVEASRQERVPLAWELEFVTSYLELQQLRFGERLRFSLEVAPAARSREVPPLVLQPLVENAIVHGVARSTGPGELAVVVAVTDGALRIELTNACEPGAPAAATTGVGLRATRERLSRIYGDRATLTAGPQGRAGFRVVLVVPCSATSRGGG